MTATWILLCGLATWRFASLLHTEDAFEWLRSLVGIGNDEKGYPAVYPETFWGKVFHCFWCLTLAAGLVIVLPVVLWERMNLIWALLLWLSSSAFAIWTEKQIMRTQSR